MSNYITNSDELREFYGVPSLPAQNKVVTRLDSHCRRLIGLAPYLVLATSNADGATDASPRGDAPGFVIVADDHTLLIPDRKGNKRVDSLMNIVSNPLVGVLFMVPGFNETLRVNGSARICIDPAVLEPLAVRDRAPEAVIEVTVNEAYLQCAKALVRSKLWDASRHQVRKDFPSFGQMLADHAGDLDASGYDQVVEESIRDRLY